MVGFSALVLGEFGRMLGPIGPGLGWGEGLGFRV